MATEDAKRKLHGRQKHLVLFAGAGVLVLLAALAVFASGTQQQHPKRRPSRKLEVGYPRYTTHKELSEEEAVTGTLMAYATQQTTWGPVWHVEEMLDSLGGGGSLTGLAEKMKAKLAEGEARPHETPRRSALPKILSRSRGNSTGKVPDKMVVVARADEDVSWLSIFLPDIPHTVYQAGWTEDKMLSWVGPLPAFKAQPQAKETNVYLQYIVSHYEKLPDTTVFIHAHRHSWHVHDVVPLLQRLRWGAISYGNLRHKGFEDWDCGSPFEDHSFPCGWEGAILTPREPFDPTFTAQPQSGAVARVAAAVHRYWGHFFEEELGPLPELVYTQCCAEFAVSRERILARPKAFYQGLLDKVNSFDWQTHYHELAIAFEYSWHIIFGEPAVTVPLAECQLLTCDKEQL